jgi:flagellar biosynthesis component FlhA
MIEKGWPAGETAESFTKLTIGDGLTSQIPVVRHLRSPAP